MVGSDHEWNWDRGYQPMGGDEHLMAPAERAAYANGFESGSDSRDAEVEHWRSESERRAHKCDALCRLIRCMIDEDPNEVVADGGVTMLDVWRKDAQHEMKTAPANAGAVERLQRMLEAITLKELKLAEENETLRAKFDLLSYLERQRIFSERTFGPGTRANGVIEHIRKELVEIEQAPRDLKEWIDVVTLALDGAWRAGFTPEQIAAQLGATLARNEKRVWPDWRTMSPDQAIEHDRNERG
jgi:hypothetical protein